MTLQKRSGLRGKYGGWIAWFCFCAFAAMGSAWAAAGSAIPVPKSLLVDEVGALKDSERDALLMRLRAIESAGHAQIAILISSGTAGVPLADYALTVAESWQLGKAGRDNGLLVLVIPSPAGARLEVGYGLEGEIPDARASQWLDDLLPAIRNKQLAQGLDHLLDQIEGVLPKSATAKASTDERYLFPDHPEWRLPFVLVVFSPFAMFPMFLGRSGGVASAFLLAVFLGGAALALWESPTAGLIAAAAVFPLPLLWGLNRDDRHHRPWLRYAKTFGNLMGVAMFFAVITLFVGVGLSAAEEPVWPGLIFSGFLAAGLAAFLFPGRPAEYLGVFLRSAMHFIFILVVAYVALHPFLLDPTEIALGVAVTITACIALALYLDSREPASAEGFRWSQLLFGIAALAVLPFGLLALFLAMGGEDFQTQLTQAAAGGGSIAGVLALAARYGLIAAVRVGLGGRFGGGGAGRSD